MLGKVAFLSKAVTHNQNFCPKVFDDGARFIHFSQQLTTINALS
jgi:hypothetical protein